MKTFITLLLVIYLVPLPAQTGDWALFPLDQKNYYGAYVSHYKGWMLHIATMDSIQQDSTGTLYHFNRKHYEQEMNGCYPDLLSQLDQYFNLEFPTSFTEKKDTLHYGKSPFYFLPEAKPGEQWTLDLGYTGGFEKLTIHCDSVDTASFFSMLDSVRYYSISVPGHPALDTLQFQLSKHFGFLKYISFNDFIWHPSNNLRQFNLWGLQNDSISKGYKLPGFHDYFGLSPGDVTYWKHVIDYWDLQLKDKLVYFKDSITSTIATKDSIVYVFDRIRNINGQIKTNYNLKKTFYREEYEHIFNAPSNSIGFGIDHFNMPDYQKQMWLINQGILRFTPDDTIMDLILYSEAWIADTISCILTAPTDHIDYRYYSTKLGFTGFYEALYGSDETLELIGFKVDGDYDGTTSIFLGKNSPQFTGLKIYPNPVAGYLYLDLPTNTVKADYLLVDIQGKIVSRGRTSGNTIPVDSLLPGIYILVVRSSDQIYRNRFLKE